MKTKAILALAMIVLGSCTQNEAPLTPATGFPADGVIRVVTSVGNAATRAGMTTNKLDKFYLNIENLSANPGIKDKYSYFATLYPNEYSAGSWDSFTENEGGTQPTPLVMLWESQSQTVSVTAICTYDEFWKQAQFNASSPVSVSADQSTDAEIQKSDLLYMAPTVIDPATDLDNGKLPIRFDHLFSKLELSVKLGSEFNLAPATASNPIEELQVNGTKLSVNFNAATGVWDHSSFATAASIIPFAGTFTPASTAISNAWARYEAIVIPQTVANGLFSVSFKIGAKKYAWTATKAEGITFNQGHIHALELNVGKDKIVVGNVTVKEWGDGTEADVETE